MTDVIETETEESEREPTPPVTVTLDGGQILARSQALYRALPQAGFSTGTFEELGIAARAGVPFSSLSLNLKRTIFTLVRDFSDELASIELAEAVAAGQTDSPPDEHDNGGQPGGDEGEAEPAAPPSGDEPFGKDPATEDAETPPPPAPPEKEQPPAAT